MVGSDDGAIEEAASHEFCDARLRHALDRIDPTSEPSRSTVIRFDISSTSASRWETKTTATPDADRLRTMFDQIIVFRLRQ